MIRRWLLIVAVFVLSFVALAMPTQASSLPAVCSGPLSEQVAIVCERLAQAEEEIEELRNRPVPTVTIRPPRVTIRPPQATVTIRPPRATVTVPGDPRTIIRTVRPEPRVVRRTVTRPGPTTTVTERPRTRTVRETVTVGPPQITATSRPRPTVTITPEPRERPTALPTAQSTADERAGSPSEPPTPSPTRQAPTTRDTLGPTPPTETEDEPAFVFPRVELSYPEVIAFSLLGLLIIMGLLLAALAAGYYLGWNELSYKNKRFLQSLSDDLFKFKRR